MKLEKLFLAKKAIITSREYLSSSSGIPCIHYGDIYKYYSHKAILSSEIINGFMLNVSSDKYISQDSIVIPDVTETINDFGNSVYIKYNGTRYINGTHTIAITSQNSTSLKYLFYYLQNNKNKKKLQSLLLGSTVFQLSLKDILKFDLVDYDINVNHQQHIIDIIGSIDDKIENNNKIIDKLYIFLDMNMKKLLNGKRYIMIRDYKDIEIISSGIDKFEKNKIYLDTSCVKNKTIIDISFNITYKNKPSRANMKPVINSVWFAKLKNSPKHIIVKSFSENILNNYIFSTGFMGIKLNEKNFNLISTYLISNIFDEEKNKLSIGATMQSINNDTFKNMHIPDFTENDFQYFNIISENVLKSIYFLEQENIKLNKLKQLYLAKFF